MQFGQPRKHFSEIDSTNRFALDWADAPHGALVVADAQTAGRGRLGRNWQSPPGKGLYFSLVLRPDEPNPARLALLAGLAVAAAVESVADVPIACKWPNDLLCHSKKIGGILCEARDTRVIVGVGLNVTHGREDLPERLVFPASSLLLESDKSFPIEPLLEAILAQLETTFAQTNWRAAYENRMWGRGEVAKSNGVLGVVDGIESDGQLRLKTADGPKLVVAGELEWMEERIKAEG